jgi:NTP pyrophosphatase (non-canonical NTP hydrolase)
MTIHQAQQQVDEWIKTNGVRYFNELTNMAILTEEVGEVARHMARIYGEQSYKKDEQNLQPSIETGRALLSDELADVLWVLICIANQTGIDLTDALKKNFEKKTNRDVSRHKENNKLM